MTDEVFEVTALLLPSLSPLLLCCKHRKHDDKESMLGSFGGEDETPVATTGLTVSQCNQVLSRSVRSLVLNQLTWTHIHDMTMRHTQMVKMGFLRKVYGILSIQLLATAIVCAMAMKMTSSELVSRTPVPFDVLYFLLRVVSPLSHHVFPLPNVIHGQTLNYLDMCPICASCTL
jgi:hypothetical protein